MSNYYAVHLKLIDNNIKCQNKYKSIKNNNSFFLSFYLKKLLFNYLTSKVFITRLFMDHTQNFPLRESCLKQGIWHDQLQANTFGSRQAWVQALP